jgi:adhesin/invasin
MLAIIGLSISLTACRDNDNDSSRESRTIEVMLQVKDAISKEALGGMKVSPRFYLEGITYDLDISIYDNGDALVAGYANEKSYQAGDIHIPGSGFLTLEIVIENLSDALLNILTSNDAAHAKLNLTISGDGYFSNVTSFELLTESSLLEKEVKLLPHSHSEDFSASFAEGTLATSDNVISEGLTLSTPVENSDSSSGEMLDGAQVSINIPSGIELLDESGQPFDPNGDLTVNMTLISGDPKGLSTPTNSPMFAFPGGLEISGLSGTPPYDLTNRSEFSFITAGLVAIEMVDEAGNKVSQFNNAGISLSFEVPKSTINPNTSQPINFSDVSIPFWSYNDKTAKWRYEGEAYIIAESSNTFTLTTQISHLTYFNLDWYQSNRCRWNVSVVDANGQPNNQRLQLSFVRKSGGWAYKPYGWGGELDTLDIQRIPAFEGTFDILSSDGTSLLGSITVDGVETSSSTGENGIELEDFCFGLSTDTVINFTAKLNINNPPRINLPLQLNLVCPTDSNNTVTTDSGSYYLYEGWSYIENGTVTDGEVDLNNLVENSVYRFYYRNTSMWSRSEFTAEQSLSELNIDTISVCPTISQNIIVRMVCLDNNQTVFKHKPAASSRYWIYNRDYYQYLSGTTNTAGSDTLTSTVDGVEYIAYAYVLNNGQYLNTGRVAFSAAAEQETTLDITLPDNDSFCTSDLPIDYTKSTISASTLNAPADGAAKIDITVQEKDEFGNNRTNNTGTLTLTATPNTGVIIENIQNLNDGTYIADISASSPADVVVTAAIDGNPLSDSLSLSFTGMPVSASQSIFTLSDTSVTTDANVTASITLKNNDGSDYGQSGGTLTLSSTPSGVTFSSITDNGDGTYTATVSSSNAASYSLSATLGSVTLTSTPSVTFIEPLPSASLSTFTLSSVSETTDNSVTLNIALKQSDGSDYGQSGGILSLSSTPSGATFNSVTDNGDGSYTATVGSTNTVDYTLTATVGSVTLTTTPLVSFTEPPPSDSESTFSLSSNSAIINTQVDINITLKQSDGSDYGQSGGTLTLSSTPSGASFDSVTDNGDGTYTATVSSATAASYSLTAALDSVTLTTTPSVTFTYPPPSASESTFTLSSATVTTDTNVTVNIVLKQFDGSDYGLSGGTLTLSSTPSGAIFGSVTDNGDGTYSATVGSATAASYTLTATLGSVTLTTTPSVTFSEPLPSASQSTFTLSSAAVAVGTNVNINIDLKNSDGSEYGLSSGALSLSSTPPGATFNAITDNGDGTYTATVGSASAASYTLTAEIGDVTLDTTPDITFTQVDAANTTVLPASLAVSVAGGPETVTVTLREADGSQVGHGGHTVSVASLFIDTLLIIPSPTITDNTDGTFTITASCTQMIGGADTVTVSVDSVEVGSFSLKCDS